MRRLLLVPFGILAAWLYWRHQRRPAEKRLQIAREWVNRGLFVWRGGERRIAKNIRLVAPELPEEQVKSHSREVAHTVGANVAYALGSWHETIDQVEYRIEIGPGLLGMKARLDQGDKIVLVLDHVAPFDGAAPVVEILGLKAGIVVEKLHPMLASFFNRSRLSWEGVHLIQTEKGQTYQKAAAFLQEHGLVAVFIDIFRSTAKSDVTCRLGTLKVGVASLPVRLAVENQASLYTLLPVWRDGVICFDASPFEMRINGDKEVSIKTETVRVFDERVIPHILGNLNHWMRAFSDDLSQFVEHNKALE